MVKEIKYAGLSASPSDYECPDGDLAAVLNVVPEEGSLSPVMPPRQLFQLSDGGNVRFVHETSYIRNFIILYPDNRITWRTQEDPDQYSHGTLTHDFSGRTIHQINAIGNTLIVLADDGMHYFLWKGYRNGSEQQDEEPKEYLYLGTHLPELSLSFGLQGELIKQDFRFGAKPTEEGFQDATGETTVTDFKAGIYDQELFDKVMTKFIKSRVNRFIKENSIDKGRFLFPFFVRYAYRLYDGNSITMHSAPILMMCSYPQGIVFNPQIHYMNEIYPIDIRKNKIFGMFHKLDYSVVSDISVLKDWKDIIRSVDIFVSNPIYTYDQDGNDYVKNHKSLDNIEYFSICKYTGLFDTEGNKIRESSDDNYRKHNIIDLIKESNVFTYDDWYEIPVRSNVIVNKDFSDCNLFYMVQSINIEDLKTERTVIDIDTLNIKNLGTGESMVDDYQTHDLLIPKYSYGYNSRFNVTDLQLRLFNGYNPASCFQFTNGTYQETVKVYIYIRQDNKEIVVGGDSYTFGFDTKYLYIYYPNPNAYKAVLEIHSQFTSKPNFYEVQLQKHEKLNGAFYFKGWYEAIEHSKHLAIGHNPLSSPDDRKVNLNSKIYTSEVNNPFYFPPLGVNTVGTGTVYAISSAAKALSQGQFGQFPLYAFSDEGVWALEVEKRQDAYGRNEIGLYSARQPITRDVCINPDSITQLDSSVLFATDRGIMLLSGSTSTCISDNLNYDQVFHIESLPSSAEIIDLAGLDKTSFFYVAFREFLLGCRMLYDYVHQRIIVYSRYINGQGEVVGPYPYAYVYSLKTKTWGMIPSQIRDGVPSYPEALAMLFDGHLADYSSDDNDGTTTAIKGMLITRPLKLEAPDVFKTVSTVIQRGNFRRGHVRSVLWGSRDLFHWSLVWSSTTHVMSGFRGTPYKYFRIGVLLDLQPDESLYGCSIEYTPRQLNRLR